MPKKVDIKTKKTVASVADFLAAIEDEQKRKDCQVIDKLIQEITGEKAAMWGKSIIGYGAYTYKRSNGAEGDWFRLGFSPRKQAITIYIMPGYKDYSKFLDKLGPHKTGKCCLYIKRLSDIDMPTLKALLTQGYNDFEN